MMRTIAFVLACLACTRHGRRLHRAPTPSKGHATSQYKGSSLFEQLNETMAEVEQLRSTTHVGVFKFLKLAIVLLALNPAAESTSSQSDEEIDDDSPWDSDDSFQDILSNAVRDKETKSDVMNTVGDEVPSQSEPLLTMEHWLNSWLKHWWNSWSLNDIVSGSSNDTSILQEGALAGSRQLPLPPVGSRWPPVPAESPLLLAASALSNLLPWISLLVGMRHSIFGAEGLSPKVPDVPAQPEAALKRKRQFSFAKGASADSTDVPEDTQPRKAREGKREVTQKEHGQQAWLKGWGKRQQSAELIRARERIAQLEEDLTSVQTDLLKQKESEMQAMVESFRLREKQLMHQQAELSEQINERITRERNDIESHYKNLLQSRERQLQAMLAEKTRLLERKDADGQAMAANFKAYEEKLAREHEELLEKVNHWQTQYQQVSRQRNEMEDHYVHLRSNESQWHALLEEKIALLEQKEAENQALSKSFKSREQQFEQDCEELLEKINLWQMQYQHVNVERNEMADQYKELQSKESFLQSMLEEKDQLLEQKDTESKAAMDGFKAREAQFENDREELLEKLNLWQVQYQHVDLERKLIADQNAELELNEKRLQSLLEDRMSLLEQSDNETKTMAESFREREQQLEHDREELRNLLQSREWQMQSMLEDKTRLLEQKDIESEQLAKSFQAREEQLEHDQEELLENIKFWQAQYQQVNEERHNIEDHYKDLLKQKDTESQATVKRFQAQEEQLEHEHVQLLEKLQLWKINYQRINRELNQIGDQNEGLRANESHLQQILEERTHLMEQKDVENKAMADSFKEREEQLEHEHKEMLEMINLWQIQYQHVNRERTKMEEQYKDNLKQREAESEAQVESIQAREEQLKYDYKELQEKTKFWKIHYQRVSRERKEIEDDRTALQLNEDRMQSMLEEKTRLLTQKEADSKAMAEGFKARVEQLHQDREELRDKINLWQTQYQRVNQERNEVEALYMDILNSKEGHSQSQIARRSRFMRQRDAKLFRARVEQLEHEREELLEKIKLWRMHYQRVNRERNEIEDRYKDLLAWRQGQLRSVTDKGDKDQSLTWAIIEQGMKSLEAVEKKLNHLREGDNADASSGFGFKRNRRKRKHKFR